MPQTSLHSDDLPPVQITAADTFLFQQLGSAVSRCFYEACDGVTQALLTKCEWSIDLHANAPLLTMTTHDQATYGRVLNNIVNVANHLSNFSQHAKIRINPPLGGSAPFEIGVDEAATFRDPA